jgi:hypothetical protein
VIGLEIRSVISFLFIFNGHFRSMQLKMSVLYTKVFWVINETKMEVEEKMVKFVGQN